MAMTEWRFRVRRPVKTAAYPDHLVHQVRRERRENQDCPAKRASPEGLDDHHRSPVNRSLYRRVLRVPKAYQVHRVRLALRATSVFPVIQGQRAPQVSQESVDFEDDQVPLESLEALDQWAVQASQVGTNQPHPDRRE